MICSTFTLLYSPYHCLVPEHFHPINWKGSLHFPVPHPSMATTRLPSVSMDLLTLGFLCKWNHRIRGICAWLFLLRIRFSRFSRIVERLMTSLIFMAEQYSIAWIYHLLFILSSGHLGCLHLRLLQRMLV